MQNFQLSLFYDLQWLIRSSNLYRKYYLLFKTLDLSNITDKNYGPGRTGYSRHAMIRASIVKHLEEIKSVPRLIEFLDSQPILADEMCSFPLGILPDESQFYCFFRKTHHSLLENIHYAINKKLINIMLSAVTGKFIFKK